MDTDKRQKIIIRLCIVLIVILIFGLYYNMKRLDNLEQQLNSAMNQINVQYSNFNGDINQLRDTINNSILDINNCNFSYGDLDIEHGTVITYMTFDLKQAIPNASYYICYSPVEKDSYVEVKASKKSDTNYEGVLALPLSNNYKFKIIEKTDDGGVKQLNTDEIIIYVYNDFYVNRVSLNSSSASESKDSLSLSYTISNNTFGYQAYEIKTAELSLYYANVLIYHEDITNKTNVDLYENNSMSGDNYFVSGSKTEMQATAIEGNDENIQNYTYYVFINKNELLKTDIIKNNENLLSQLKQIITITLYNGEKIEL